MGEDEGCYNILTRALDCNSYPPIHSRPEKIGLVENVGTTNVDTNI